MAISVVMSILRFFVIAANMEKNNPNADLYYLPKNAVVIAFSIASAILLVAFAISAFKLSNKSAIVLDDRSGSVSVGALVLGFAFVGASIMYFWSLNAESAPPVIGGVPNMPMPVNEKGSTIEFIVVAFGIASAMKFMFQGVYNNRKGNLDKRFFALVTLVPIIFSAFRLLDEFINSSAAPLASSGAYHLLGLIAALLFFLSEGRSYAIPTKSVFFDIYGYCSIYLLLVYSVPHVVAHCLGAFSFDIEAVMSVVDIAIAVYIVTRIINSKTVPFEKNVEE